ncbi:MAG: type II secretion system protein [Verrucomicrobia bacterium]|nr:type II secretion system protein [Verrucomicrobiota bacterium]
MGMPQHPLKQSGFTLVEIMIVVAIIGLLAVMSVPAFQKSRRTSLQTAFVNDMRVFSNAAEYFTLSSGYFLEDGASGVMPLGLDEFVEADRWTRGTPIGGSWDSEQDDSGITSGIGVHFNGDSNPGDAYMAEIDAKYDDGNLATGIFRKIADDRYYYIVAE